MFRNSIEVKRIQIHFVRVAFSYTLIAILPMKRIKKIFLALAAAAIILATLVFLAAVASDPVVAFWN
jgi:hypothetical protein